MGQKFATLNDIDLPYELRQQCEGFTEKQFRMDVSSSDLRPLAEQD